MSAAAEIDHVSSLFQEKQAELQSAVVRVDQVRWRVEGRVTLSEFVSGELLSSFYLVLPVDPAVGGFEERAPSAALCCTSSGGARRVPGRTSWPERVTPVWSCSPGAEEALPGAAGKSHHLMISFV